MLLVDAIYRHARRSPQGVALSEGGRDVTFAALSREMDRWALALASRGIGGGERVGICLKDTVAHVLAMLATARLGAVIVPLDWRAPPAQTAELVRRFDVELLLHEAGASVSASCAAIAADDRWLALVAAQRGAPHARIDADTPLIIKMSSGTTGKPKGALVTHGQFMRRVALNEGSFGPLAGDRYLSATPLYFGAGSQYCKMHLALGNTVILHPTLFSPEEYVAAVARHRATFLFAVPTLLQRLLPLAPADGVLFDAVRVLLCGGAALPARDKLAVAQRVCANFHELYATSAAGQISLLRPQDLALAAHTAGRIVEGVEVGIVDEQGGALPVGATGRLRCRGASVSTQFVGTGGDRGASESIEDGWCHTGDLASIDAHGYLHIAGRCDDVIVRGGVNVYPAVIEEVLSAHPGIREAAVVGRASREFGAVPVAYIVTDAEVPDRELLAHCRRALSAESVPAAFERVAALPKTTSGKVQRRRLSAAPNVGGDSAPICGRSFSPD